MKVLLHIGRDHGTDFSAGGFWPGAELRPDEPCF
jgi:hypothetical protein